MREQIELELRRLEQEHNIRILYAVESGSRAWGFASKDSDWDVRFIYVHQLDWYLDIDERKDSLEEILPNEIDLAGWELRKALRLYRKSNPPLLEWLISPIVYFQQGSFAESLRELSLVYFNPKSCIYHYLHMAERNFNEYLRRDMVRVKKYFYVLRPILACEWIRLKSEMAPLEFRVLYEELVEDPLVKIEIEGLMKRKQEGEELDVEPKNVILNHFLQAKLDYYKEHVKDFDRNLQFDKSELNSLFMHLFDRAWAPRDI